MKKISILSPLLLLILLPFLHSCKELNGSLLMLCNLCVYKGGLPLLKAILTFPLKAIFAAGLFYLFIDKVAPKLSLFLLSSSLAIAYYLLLPSDFFYKNLGIFILASSACFKDKKQTKHLFFSLFYITLLHTLSSILVCIHFYGYNQALFFISTTPILCLYLLKCREIYPSKMTLISLFPLTLFPVSYFVHCPVTLTLPLVCSGILLLFGIYILLKGKSIKKLSLLAAISSIHLLFLNKTLIFPFIFLPISLCIGILQLLYASRYRPSFPANTLPHPMRQLILRQDALLTKEKSTGIKGYKYLT